MKALPVLSAVAGTLAFCSPALAHCRVTDLKLQQAISQDSKLRQSANAQVVRDLRTLREAALILDAKRAIETSSDTDEDKAEVLDKTRRQETAALKNPAQ